MIAAAAVDRGATDAAGEIRYERVDPHRYSRIDLGAVAVTVER
jgi:hypothetical protein